MIADLESERAVIGGILVDCGPLPPGIDSLTPDDFAEPKHAAIFAAMLALAERKEPIDDVTVSHELGGGDWTKLVTKLSADMPTSANVGYYANLVRRDARRRDCVRVMGEALVECRKPGVDGDGVIASVVTELGSIAASRGVSNRTPVRCS